MGKEEQRQWERKWAPFAAAAAALAALLPIASTVWGSSLLGKLPDENTEQVVLERIHSHASAYALAGVLGGIGLAFAAPVLAYLYRAIQARRPQIPRIALVLAIVAPLVAGGVAVARQLVVVDVAHQFVKEPEKATTPAQREKLKNAKGPDEYEKITQELGRNGEAKDKLQSGSVATVEYARLIANLLLGTAFVLIAMHAMRAGLLSKFMGILGVIVGALTAVPLLGGAPVVQLFWLLAMMVLFLDRWPQGRGPAWEAVEEIPWPTAQDRRDALADRDDDAPARAGRAGRGRVAATEPDDDEELVEEAEPVKQHTREAVRPRPSSTHPRSKKRKRKRRG